MCIFPKQIRRCTSLHNTTYKTITNSAYVVKPTRLRSVYIVCTMFFRLRDMVYSRSYGKGTHRNTMLLLLYVYVQYVTGNRFTVPFLNMYTLSAYIKFQQTR